MRYFIRFSNDCDVYSNSNIVTVSSMEKWFSDNVSPEWPKCRARLMRILQEEAELQEIVQLVGIDAGSTADRITLEAARSVREDYLHQNAFHEVDTFSSMKKQFLLMKLVLEFYDKSIEAQKNGASINSILNIESREKIGRFKYVSEENIEAEYNNIVAQLEAETANLAGKEEA